MRPALPVLVALFAAFAASFASAAAAAASPADADAVEQRLVLVMLREAPPHFRPDAAYAGGYGARAGREALRRIADALAREHDLAVVDEWPMPALGLDCFVMRIAGSTSADDASAM